MPFFLARDYNFKSKLNRIADTDGIDMKTKEVSKGSAIDDAFNNISGIHALNEFNRLPG